MRELRQDPRIQGGRCARFFTRLLPTSTCQCGRGESCTKPEIAQEDSVHNAKTLESSRISTFADSACVMVYIANPRLINTDLTFLHYNFRPEKTFTSYKVPTRAEREYDYQPSAPVAR